MHPRPWWFVCDGERRRHFEHHFAGLDAQRGAALRLAVEGAKPANGAVSLSDFSLHAPKQPTAQTRNADITVPSGNLKRGFASDERRGI